MVLKSNQLPDRSKYVPDTISILHSAHLMYVTVKIPLEDFKGKETITINDLLSASVCVSVGSPQPFRTILDNCSLLQVIFAVTEPFIMWG